MTTTPVSLSLKVRAELYNTAFPKYAKQAWLQASDRWLWGVWMMGNNYKGSGYHGCLSPDTQVLDADLSWVKHSEIKQGAMLVGVDEYPIRNESGNLTRRRLRLSEVVDIGDVVLPSVAITTDDDRCIICSNDHLWLVINCHGVTMWQRADHLCVGDKIRKITNMWDPPDMYEAGYIAGLIDGEGSVDTNGVNNSNVRVAFHQNPGIVLNKYIEILNKWGINYKATQRAHGNITVRTMSFHDAFKLLALARPTKPKDIWIGRGLPKERGQPYSVVTSITPLGDIRLIGMNTSTKTFIAEGLVSHNSFPPNFLSRTMSMFPEAEDILHLFSGSLTSEVKGDRLDMNANMQPDICGDAHELSNLVKKDYDLIIADPPYSEEDANKYGTPMVNRNAIVKECVKVLKPGGHLVWLDMVYPMYSNKELQLVGTIGIIRSTNHRVRAVFIYQKLL